MLLTFACTLWKSFLYFDHAKFRTHLKPYLSQKIRTTVFGNNLGTLLAKGGVIATMQLYSDIFASGLHCFEIVEVKKKY